MAARSQRTKLSLSDLGAPSKLLAAPDTVRDYVMGRIIGRATKFTERTSPKDGSVFEGLAGSFRIIPSDTEREELESGVLFIPDAFHNIVAEQLRAAQKVDANAAVEFGFEVKAIRANNPAKYSWDFRPLLTETSNPLDAVLEQIALAQSNVKQIDAPKPKAATK